jgi:hypothetical protein
MIRAPAPFSVTRLHHRSIYTSKVTPFRKSRTVHRPLTVARGLPLDWNTLSYESYLIGKGIIVFTMVYCTLNWLHYKRVREESEKDKDD